MADTPESHPADDNVDVPAALRPLIARFRERTGTEIARLHTALAAADWHGIEQIAHKLKGSSGSYGFLHLGNLAGRLEAAAKASDADASSALVSAIDAHFARATIRYV